MPIHITDFLEEKSGLIKKKDLRRSPNLKQVFSSINQHLYGKLKYTDTDTRARSKQIINLLLCKLVDEINKTSEEEVEFCIRTDESDKQLLKRVQSFFNINVREKYKDIIDENEQITLTKELVYIIVKELQHISLLQSSKDILSDAFEIFVSKILKDEAGQFFTPANIIKFMVNYLDPVVDSKILDPACGHGGFLLEAKDILWSKIESKEKRIESISNLFGIDKDLFLAKISKLYLEILSNGKSNIFCEDSLDPKSYRVPARQVIKNNTFDYVFTNPPFGVKIPINKKEILMDYQLGHTWKIIDGRWEIQDKLVRQQAPQVLFIERCVQLLRDGGKLGIILPEGIFGNPTDRYIWEYLTSNGKILGIISLDQNTFQPYTCNKTSILFFEKSKEISIDYIIDFAIVENVGHDKDGKILYKLNKDGSKKLDSVGNLIVNDDLIDLHLTIKDAEEFDYLKEQKIFKIRYSNVKNKIFIPVYYTGVEKTLKKLENDKNFTLATIQDLVDKKIIYSNKGGYLPRGDEIGSHVYGLGDIPFIRTSELNNWEINLDSYKKTSEEVYEQYKSKQNIEEGDILLVKDGGPNLIGKTAYITELDTKIIIQSHIFQIKTLENNEFIDSYLLLYLLNLEIVQKQIQAITFVQGTIATIGNRIMEVVLPIPSDFNKRKEISDYIKKIINSKIEIKKEIQKISRYYEY
ncbi:MAG: N-6 DNA methylase [Promethearchaeota archaeon]|nr:MAG: N-6 DNA methylase [Candidatus Lokiarchaeota archaeon]